MPFLHLIRYKNIIMIAVMVFMIKLCAVDPILDLFRLEPTFHWGDFAFLALALCCVAAGGYVINDVFDTKADSVNRPGNTIVGQSISAEQASSIHKVLSVAGCILGLLVSIKIGFWPLALVFPFHVGLLWFYSSAYKGMFLVGNLVVAFMTAVVPLMPALYELRGLLTSNPFVIKEGAMDPYILLNMPLGYAVFAFLATLIREIIKDMEDVEGDRAQGCSTMPIVLGINTCKIIVVALIAITIAGLHYAYLWHVNELSTGIYFLVALVIPLLYLAYRVFKIQDSHDCHTCSGIAKIIMLLGMCYLFMVWHTFAHYLEEW